MTITDEESKRINKLLGSFASPALSTAVVRLYIAHPNGGPWHYTGICGAAVLSVDRSHEVKPKTISIYDLRTFEVKFREELHEDMVYYVLRNHFHSFETEHAIIGLCFVSDEVAKSFWSKVIGVIPKPVPGAPVGKKGFLSGILKPKATTVGLPTNFQHKQHIGYNESGAMVMNISDEWKDYFKSMGISKKFLQSNPDVAEKVFNTLEQHQSVTGHLPPAPPPTQRRAPPALPQYATSPPSGAVPGMTSPVSAAVGPPRAPPPRRTPPNPILGRAPSAPQPAASLPHESGFQAPSPPVDQESFVPVAPVVPVAPPVLPDPAPLVPAGNIPVAPPIPPAHIPVTLPALTISEAPSLAINIPARPPVLPSPSSSNNPLGPLQPSESKADLLASIRNFKKDDVLKKVATETKTEPEDAVQSPSEDSGTYSLMKALQDAMKGRRNFTAEEQEDEDDWDD